MLAIIVPIDNERLASEFRKLKSPLRFFLWTLWKFPAARFAGIRIDKLEQGSCVVSIPGGWRSQNPFSSMYWAVQGMGAELATAGVPLALVNSMDERVRTLVASQEAKFIKKAVGRITFTCKDGDLARSAIEESISTGKSVFADFKATGTDSSGEVVSEWTFKWNFLVQDKR
ncbi:MAG: thioesterase [Euryarchaeota archaeon]|nr:thioesterase [Euryarchaeota archaeon]